MPYKTGSTTQGRSGRAEVLDVFHSPDVYANNVNIALWQPPGIVIDGIYIPADPYQFFHAEAILTEAGGNAPHDDPDSTVVSYPSVGTEPASVDNPVTNLEQGRVSSGNSVTCGSVAEPINYNDKLSSNFLIRDLSIGCAFPHNIVAQNGLSVNDIICNLKGLAENILEPLKQRYAGFRINSGFRRGISNSQHNKGMACDLQWPGLSPAGYTPIAEWMRANLPFDQLIFEHGNSIWIHVSYNRASSTQRNAVLTYYPKNSPQYKSGLTNYYA
jgi:hypothetical protein